MNSNDSELPLDIGSLISTYLNTIQISTASLVCKNWNKVFSSDNVWKMRLKSEGILDPDAVLKQFSSSTFKDLYKRINARERFKHFFYNDQLTENLVHVDIDRICLQKIAAACFKLEETDAEKNERLQARLFNNADLKLYSSMSQYVVEHLLPQSDVVKEPLIGSQAKDDTLLTDEKKVVDNYISAVSSNDGLNKYFQYLNTANLKLFTLLYDLSSLAGVLICGNGEVSYKEHCALILSGSGTIFYTWTRAGCSGFSPDEVFHYRTINNCVNFTVEISDKGITLVNYNVAVSKKFYPYFSQLLNSEKLLDELQDQYKTPQMK